MLQELANPLFSGIIISGTPFTARLVEYMLKSETIQRSVRDGQHDIWIRIRSRIFSHTRTAHLSESKASYYYRHLQIAVLEELNNISQSLIDNLIAAIGNRYCSSINCSKRPHAELNILHHFKTIVSLSFISHQIVFIFFSHRYKELKIPYNFFLLFFLYCKLIYLYSQFYALSLAVMQ